MGKYTKQEARVKTWICKLIGSYPSQMMRRWYDTNHLHKWFCHDDLESQIPSVIFKKKIRDLIQSNQLGYNSYYEDKKDRNKRIGVCLFLGPKEKLTGSPWPYARQSMRNPLVRLGRSSQTKEEQEVLVTPTVQTDPQQSSNTFKQQNSNTSDLFPYVSYWESEMAKECFGYVRDNGINCVPIEEVII